MRTFKTLGLPKGSSKMLALGLNRRTVGPQRTFAIKSLIFKEHLWAMRTSDFDDFLFVSIFIYRRIVKFHGRRLMESPLKSPLKINMTI